MWEAVGRRLRRNYFAIFFGMLFVWIFKNVSQPTTIVSWDEFVTRASIGPLSGELVLALLTIFFVGMIGLAMGTLGLQQATGEVLTPYRGLEELLLHHASEKSNAEKLM